MRSRDELRALIANGARAARNAACAVVVAAAVATAAAAQPSPAPMGDWHGVLQGILRIVLHFDLPGAGAVSGTMDSPDQGVAGIPLDSIRVDGDSLHFQVHRVRGAFAGRFVPPGDSTAGRWSQAGMSLPLGLRRGAGPAGGLRPQEPVPPFPYLEEEVRVENRDAGILLSGTLTRPQGEGPFPCAVLITGSGPEDRDETVFGHRPFLVLADHLARRGIAVLRMDDRGVARSGGRFAGATSADFAGDILAGIEFLAGRAWIDPSRIGVVGHSEGGLIATLVGERAERLAFMVMLASPGVRGDSLLQMQSTSLRRGAGLSDSAIARGAALNARLYERIVARDSLGALQIVRALVHEEIGVLPGDNRGATGDPDRIATGIFHGVYTPWMRFLLTYDPRPALRRLKCPVLAISGDRDLQVPFRENLGAIETTLRSAGHRDFTVKSLPGLNHLFQTCRTCTLEEYMQLEETFAPSALDEISGWIASRMRVKR